MVKSQLWNEYRGALARGDARFMARWRQSLTPYDRARLDRMIAEDAQRADLDDDGSGHLNRRIVTLAECAAVSPAMAQAYVGSAETEARLRALSRSSGRSLDRLRRELQAHVATRVLPPRWSVGSFCAQVQRERLSQKTRHLTHPFLLPPGADDLG